MVVLSERGEAARILVAQPKSSTTSQRTKRVYWMLDTAHADEAEVRQAFHSSSYACATLCMPPGRHHDTDNGIMIQTMESYIVKVFLDRSAEPGAFIGALPIPSLASYRMNP